MTPIPQDHPMTDTRETVRAEATKKRLEPAAGRVGNPCCGTCDKKLEWVGSGPGWMNSEQWDATKAGEYLTGKCDQIDCPGRPANGNRYFGEVATPPEPAAPRVRTAGTAGEAGTDTDCGRGEHRRVREQRDGYARRLPRPQATEGLDMTDTRPPNRRPEGTGTMTVTQDDLQFMRGKSLIVVGPDVDMVADERETDEILALAIHGLNCQAAGITAERLGDIQMVPVIDMDGVRA